MKKCKTCEQEKPETDFTKCKLAKDGLAYVCNSCRALYEQQRRIKRGVAQKPKPVVLGEERKECLRCHVILHVDDFPKSKRGRLGRGPYCIKCTKEYHKNLRANPEVREAARLATQKYRDERREHWRALHRVNQYNRKNLVKAKSDGTITEEFMKQLYATTHCYWCNKHTPVDKRTAEHIIPLAKGGIHGISNLRMACLSCNSSKLNF